jgi:DNA-binding MarR family transcriptional regulator
MVDFINLHPAMNPSKRRETASALSTFQAFMTLFGSVRQLLKTRMQDDTRHTLGPVHLRALSLCQRHPGWTQQQLGQAMGRDKGQITRLIRELEEHGLLTRSPDELDRRVWRLNVSAAGEKECAWFLAIEASLAGDLFGGLAAKEREQLVQLLGGVQERIGTASDEA